MSVKFNFLHSKKWFVGVGPLFSFFLLGGGVSHPHVCIPGYYIRLLYKVKCKNGFVIVAMSVMYI